MKTNNLKKIGWVVNLIINNMGMSMKAVSMYFKLNCCIHLKNLTSRHFLSNGLQKNRYTQLQFVLLKNGSQVDKKN